MSTEGCCEDAIGVWCLQGLICVYPENIEGNA